MERADNEVTLAKTLVSSQPPPATHVQRSAMQLERLLTPEKEENLTEVFTLSLSAIFANTLEDIQESLAHFSKESLCKLHKALCSKVVETFPQYSDRKQINRQVKHTLVSDISALGYSLHNNSPLKDLEKIFHQPTPSSENSASQPVSSSQLTSSTQQSEVNELLAIVAALSTRLSQLETEVRRLRTELHHEARHPLTSASSQTASTDSDDSEAEEELVLDGNRVDGQSLTVTETETETQENEYTAAVDQDRDETTQPKIKFQVPRAQSRRAKRHQRRLETRRTSQVTHNRTSAVANSAPTEAPVSNCDNMSQAPSSTPIVLTAAQSAPSPAGGNPLTAATSRKAYIYIGGVSGRNSVNDVKQHVEKLGSNCYSVKPLCSDRNWRSYKAEIDLSAKDLVCDASKWPAGISVRPFRPQRANSHNRSVNSSTNWTDRPRQYQSRWTDNRERNHNADHRASNSRRPEPNSYRVQQNRWSSHKWSSSDNQRERYPFRRP